MPLYAIQVGSSSYILIFSKISYLYKILIFQKFLTLFLESTSKTVRTEKLEKKVKLPNF